MTTGSTAAEIAARAQAGRRGARSRSGSRAHAAPGRPLRQAHADVQHRPRRSPRSRRTPATSSASRPTPAARCTWSSRSASRWTTSCCAAPASTTTSTPTCAATRRGRPSSRRAAPTPSALFAFTTDGRARLRRRRLAARRLARVRQRRPPGLPPPVRATIDAAQRVRLPMRPGQRSLNLSNAVAVAVFEAWRQNGYAGGELTRRRAYALSCSARASRRISCSSACAGASAPASTSHHRGDDRHLDAARAARAAAPSARCARPRRHGRARRGCCAQRLALRRAQADRAVARQVAGGGEDQVAEARQAHEGLGARRRGRRRGASSRPGRA